VRSTQTEFPLDGMDMSEPDPKKHTRPERWQTTYFGPHYLAIYAQRLLQPMETGWEASFIPLALKLKAGSTILDVPCGFGRHMHRMRLAGYKVFGMDLQVSYLDYARQSTVSAQWESVPVAAGDMAFLPFQNESFDALANVFNSFGYFSDDRQSGQPTNQNVLEEFARVLKPGGKILIDVAEREELLLAIEESPRSHCAGEDWEIIEEWEYNPDTKRLRNHTQFVVQEHRQECGYDMRLYTREELEQALREAGLIPFRFWSDLHRDADEESGDRLVIAAEKQSAK